MRNPISMRDPACPNTLNSCDKTHNHISQSMHSHLLGRDPKNPPMPNKPTHTANTPRQLNQMNCTLNPCIKTQADTWPTTTDLCHKRPAHPSNLPLQISCCVCRTVRLVVRREHWMRQQNITQNLTVVIPPFWYAKSTSRAVLRTRGAVDEQRRWHQTLKRYGEGSRYWRRCKSITASD